MGATYEGNAFCLRIAGGADGRSRVDAADIGFVPTNAIKALVRDFGPNLRTDVAGREVTDRARMADPLDNLG